MPYICSDYVAVTNLLHFVLTYLCLIGHFLCCVISCCTPSLWINCVSYQCSHCICECCGHAVLLHFVVTWMICCCQDFMSSVMLCQNEMAVYRFTLTSRPEVLALSETFSMFTDIAAKLISIFLRHSWQKKVKDHLVDFLWFFDHDHVTCVFDNKQLRARNSLQHKQKRIPSNAISELEYAFKCSCKSKHVKIISLKFFCEKSC